ncbi:hypothetical protein M9H77_28080 [Catharanthus roseus]|uniref:Uncharacterized protein n=1 Tax=Catharanthus roseus TaxID=4058 RepID=A0ACC0AFR6_CATRO|nr:hypothetical protein M9H77_28080 [Catharanthus roseus]
MKVNTHLIVTQYLSSRTSDRRPYVTLGCEHGGANKPRTKPIVDNEEEEVQIKRRGHNHAIGVYTHGHAQAVKLTKKQLIQTKQFMKSHVLPRNILRFFQEQNVGCVVSAQKIYNVVAKIKKNRMYNMPLLEVVGMTPIGKNFTVATTFMRNEQAMTYRWVLQQIKHLYFSSTMSIESQQDLNVHEPKWRKRPDFLYYLFTTWLNPLAHKFVRVWTGRVMHFGVDTTNRAESEHSILKLWLSTCHGDLDTVFLNIDSLIQSQITDIKSSLENSRTKEKFNAKSNLILRNISNKISHLALKNIWVEIKRAAEIIDDPKNKCGHYMRISQGLPCSCELITWFGHMLPIQFFSSFNIGEDTDMDSEMHSLIDLLHQISTGLISKVREMHRLVKGLLDSVLPVDPCMTLTSPPEVAVTKERKKTNSTKRDKSY